MTWLRQGRVAGCGCSGSCLQRRAPQLGGEPAAKAKLGRCGSTCITHSPACWRRRGVHRHVVSTGITWLWQESSSLTLPVRNGGGFPSFVQCVSHRTASYYWDSQRRPYRSLMKLYGIRFDISVHGQVPYRWKTLHAQSCLAFHRQQLLALLTAAPSCH